MKKIYPNKLKVGDEIRIVAPARSLGLLSEELKQVADKKLRELGFKLSFGKNITTMDSFDSSSIEGRVSDLHEAFRDQNVKGVLTVIGGFNCNQLLRYLDWGLIKQNPKIFCGFSDITALNNAIFAKTGLVTYSGPHYSSYGQKLHFEYTLEYAIKCLMTEDLVEIMPSPTWSDDKWYFDQEKRTLLPNIGYLIINEGNAQGTIVGGNLCTYNLLQGTEYFPTLKDTILFIEDDYESQPHAFDRDLQSVIHQPGFTGVKGIVIGRFQKESHMTLEKLTQIIRSKAELNSIPVVANVDFGHSDPKITYPIGGEAKISVTKESAKITILRH